MDVGFDGLSYVVTLKINNAQGQKFNAKESAYVDLHKNMPCLKSTGEGSGLVKNKIITAALLLLKLLWYNNGCITIFFKKSTYS